jgi:hypothetical protein
MGGAGMMIVKVLRQFVAQRLVITDGELKKQLLNIARQVWPQMEGCFAKQLFKSNWVVRHQNSSAPSGNADHAAKVS